MCGRFTIAIDPAELQEEFDIPAMPADWVIRYNVAPTQPVAVVTDAGARMIEFYKWGLVPFWAKDESIGSKMINARAETIMEKPSFKRPFLKQRCLILADGFYEWKKSASGKGPSEPYRILRRDKKPFAFAGLWETWHPKEGPEIRTCTIITTEANSVVAPIHDRMPVMLEKVNYWKWLVDSDPTDLKKMLAPFPASLMTAYPISRRVNDNKVDEPDLIKPNENSLFK